MFMFHVSILLVSICLLKISINTVTDISYISSQCQGARTGGCSQRVPSGARRGPQIEHGPRARSGPPELFLLTCRPPLHHCSSSHCSPSGLLACLSVRLSVSCSSVCALLLSLCDEGTWEVLASTSTFG